MPLVLIYSQKFNSLNSIIRKHLPLLKFSNQPCVTFQEPSILAFRRARNLRDILVRAKLPQNKPDGPTQDTGCFKCTRKCAVCKHITENKKFTSTITKESFPITDHISCRYTWIIYLVTCKVCQKQYVGKTQTTRYTRFSNHRSDIRLYNTPRGKIYFLRLTNLTYLIIACG